MILRGSIGSSRPGWGGMWDEWRGRRIFRSCVKRLGGLWLQIRLDTSLQQQLRSASWLSREYQSALDIDNPKLAQGKARNVSYYDHHHAAPPLTTTPICNCIPNEGIQLLSATTLNPSSSASPYLHLQHHRTHRISVFYTHQSHASPVQRIPRLDRL